MVTVLSDALVSDGDWQYGLKNRQGAAGTFPTLAELFTHLKASGSDRGGGTIYRLIPTSLVGVEFDIEGEFSRAVARFEGLMRVLRPSAAERGFMADTEAVRRFAQDLPEGNDEAETLGKLWLLRQVAVRQGQAKFRDKLIEAYGGRCAITGTRILATLQAAHIEPYNGPATNRVENGILLRADVHNLFDLGLLQIDPDELTIVTAPVIRDSSFGKLHGRPLRLPTRPRDRPSVQSLRARWDAFQGHLLG